MTNRDLTFADLRVPDSLLFELKRWGVHAPVELAVIAAATIESLGSQASARGLRRPEDVLSWFLSSLYHHYVVAEEPVVELSATCNGVSRQYRVLVVADKLRIESAMEVSEPQAEGCSADEQLECSILEPSARANGALTGECSINPIDDPLSDLDAAIATLTERERAVLT